MKSILDQLYAWHSNKLLFFRQGWGDLAGIRRLIAAGFAISPVHDLSIVRGQERREKDARIRQGRFLSSFEAAGFPQESHMGYVEMVLPLLVTDKTPVCLHFAATGDEGFTRRRIVMALPLARHGVGSLIFENPFYGQRRPAGQHSKMLNRFSDLLVMGAATVCEGRSLMRWLRKEGYVRLGTCGISMGGQMAAQVGSLAESPAAIVACIAPHSATAVFTEGILKNYLAWPVLERELDKEGKAWDLVRDVLDLTDIRNYPVPANTKACMLVAAENDAYIPSESSLTLHRHWPGSTMKWLRGGHVSAFLFHRREFVAAVIRAFENL